MRVWTVEQCFPLGHRNNTFQCHDVFCFFALPAHGTVVRCGFIWCWLLVSGYECECWVVCEFEFPFYLIVGVVIWKLEILTFYMSDINVCMIYLGL